MEAGVGRLARFKEDAEGGGGLYLVLIVSRSFSNDERWRCLVLNDDLNAADAGLIVEYTDRVLEEYFEHV